MFLLGLLLAGVVVSPRPSGGAADPRQSILFGLVLFTILCGAAMLGLLFMGFGSLYDWWTVRGWRHPSQRRKLK